MINLFKYMIGTFIYPSIIPNSLFNSFIICSIIVKIVLNIFICYTEPITVKLFSFLKKSAYY